MFGGCNQENEKEVLLLGGGHEPQGGQESQEALPCQCGEVEGGLSDERGERNVFYLILCFCF